MVRVDGVEGALEALFRGGVCPHRRRVQGTPARGPRRHDDCLRSPPSAQSDLRPSSVGSTSGSRGTSTRIPLDLACVRDWAVNMNLALDARGGAGWQRAVWGTPGIIPLLWYSAPGIPAARWFIKVDPGALWSSVATSMGHPRRRMDEPPRPSATSVAGDAPVDDPRCILEWMRTTPDTVIRCTCGARQARGHDCHAAEREGVDLDGAHFTITGEPVTEACLAAIRRVHGDAMPDYGSVDSGGSVTYGCLSPEAADDVHVFSDLNAVIRLTGSRFPGARSSSHPLGRRLRSYCSTCRWATGPR